MSAASPVQKSMRRKATKPDSSFNRVGQMTADPNVHSARLMKATSAWSGRCDQCDLHLFRHAEVRDDFLLRLR